MNTQEKEQKVCKVGAAASAVEGMLFDDAWLQDQIDQIRSRATFEGEFGDGDDEANERAWNAWYQAATRCILLFADTRARADRSKVVDAMDRASWRQPKVTSDHKKRVAENKVAVKKEVAADKAALKANPVGWFESALNSARKRAQKMGFTGGLKTGGLTAGKLKTGKLTTGHL